MSNSNTRIGSTHLITLYEKQNGRCFYCSKDLWNGESTDISIDHKNPSSRGGKKELGNLCLACVDCNGLKQSLTDKEFKVALDLIKQGMIERKKIKDYSDYLLAKDRLKVKKF